MYVQSDTCLVLDWVCKTWIKFRSKKACTSVCACVCFFQDLFLLPKVLNFGSRGGCVWTCPVHPLKSCYGRGKDVYKINCQAFPMLLSLCPHHCLCFFPIVRDNEVPLSLPAKEAQILGLPSGLSTGGLGDDGLKDVGIQEHFHMPINYCGKACPQAPGPQWWLC